MKRIVVTLLLACSLCFVTACSGTDQSADSNSDVSSGKSVNLEASVKGYYAKEYDFDTDYQSYFLWPGVTRAEDGYYYWDVDKERLMYYDISTGQGVVLCNKANCTHEDENCNAFFRRSSESGEYYCKSYLQYYDGDVYLAGRDPDGYVNLYRASADGSSCDMYMHLFRQTANSVTGESDVASFAEPDVCIHRGYVYYINKMEKEPKLYRVKLGGKKSEVIYENKGLRPSTYRIKAYGDKIYFQSGNFEDESYIDIEGGIYAYDINSGEVSLYKDSVISTYLFYQDVLYYSGSKGIYRYDQEKDKATKILDLERSNNQFTVIDESTIAVFDEESLTLVVYDLEKDTKKEIQDDHLSSCYFGDGYLFFADGIDGENSAVYTIKVEELEDGSEWTKIENANK